jgi:ubiquitin-conjugating enzyme E2 S
MRRLAGDHGSLHTAGLPPNYLFPPNQESSDLTSLDILLAGPVGTPYASGVWRLHLDIPPTYPAAPPTATFRTRLWHPNIDEASGAVCVETLKRDWKSELKLRDVLVTISCLLIQPNPASALNEEAGKLAQEDWEGYCRRAKLMTGIHAGVPRDLAAEVREAQMRGEDKAANVEEKAVKAVVDRKGKGKDKEIVKATPAAASKGVVQKLAVDDEENLRRRGDTAEPESDPESDWIPGPVKSPKAFAPTRDNIFGIKGLEHAMHLDTPLKKITFEGSRTSKQEEDTGDGDTSDPFITVTSRHHAPTSFSLRVPHPAPSQQTENTATATPDLLKFSSQNPFSAIQPNNQQHPLLTEFSWSWQDSEIMHDTGLTKDGGSKGDVRKRMAGKEFDERRAWESKKFKKAGYDLRKFNRGEFGPRTGIARL